MLREMQPKFPSYLLDSDGQIHPGSLSYDDLVEENQDQFVWGLGELFLALLHLAAEHHFATHYCWQWDE